MREDIYESFKTAATSRGAQLGVERWDAKEIAIVAVKDFISNVWRRPSEKIDENKRLIIEYYNGSVNIVPRKTFVFDFENRIKRWAYLDDLLCPENNDIRPK
jgi:hypothetical protein